MSNAIESDTKPLTFSYPDRGYPESLNLTKTALQELLGEDYEEGIEETNLELNDEERLELYDFEQSLLYKHNIEFNDEKKPDSPIKISTIEKIQNYSIDSSEFILNYFLTTEGKASLSKIFLPYNQKEPSSTIETIPDFQEISEIQEFFYSLDWSKIDSENKNKILDRITKDSVDWFDKEMSDLIVKFEAEEDPELKNKIKMRASGFKKLSLVHNPTKYFEYDKALRELKSYYKNIDTNIFNDSKPDKLEIAKRVVYAAHRSKVNALIAANYSYRFDLLLEYSAASNKREVADKRLLDLENVVKKLFSDNVIDSFKIATEEDFSNHIQRMSSRLTRYIYGTSEDYYEAGVDSEEKSRKYFSPISSQLKKLQEEAEKFPDSRTPANEYEVSEEIIEFINNKLDINDIDSENYKQFVDSYQIDNDDITDIYNAILEKLNIKSNEDYDPDKKGPPHDKKIRLGFSKGSTMSVNTDELVIKYPKDFRRSFLSAISTITHEMKHAIQAVNKFRNNLGISNHEDKHLAISQELTIPRGTLSAEGGALEVEREIKNELTGEDISESFAYTETIQKKMEGGDFFECALAFYRRFRLENLQQSEDKEKNSSREHAIRAASRTRRIFRGTIDFDDRSGLVANTKDLNYVESSLLRQIIDKDSSLSEILGLSGANPRFYALFNKLGLINTQNFVKMPDGYRNLGHLVLDVAFDVILAKFP